MIIKDNMLWQCEECTMAYMKGTLSEEYNLLCRHYRLDLHDSVGDDNNYDDNDGDDDEEHSDYSS